MPTTLPLLLRLLPTLALLFAPVLVLSLASPATSHTLSHAAGPAPSWEVQAGLTLSNLFTSSMVLQRQPASARMWGNGPAGTAVSVSIDSQDSVNTTCDASGYWIVALPPQPAGLGHVVTVTGGGAELTLTDVAFGDVYLCSGQSNMQINLNFSWGGAEAIANASAYPHLRLFNLPQMNSDTPLNSSAVSFSTWMAPSAASLACGPGCIWGPFSGVCYYMGRDLYETVNRGGQSLVSIGLLHASYGGTVVEAWTSPDALSSCGPVPANPPGSNPTGQNNASACYNAMIHPLLPMQFSAVLWYQGESNTFDASRYACAFPAMITDWRAKFQQPRLPFFFVLLAPYIDPAFVTLRQSQLAALALPMTAVANAIDLGDLASPQGSVHPRNKTVVAARLAALVLRNVYHYDVAVAGPSSPTAGQVTAVMAGSTLSVEVSYGGEDVDAGLHVIASPQCTSCCANGTGLVTLIVNNATVYPVVTVDPATRTLYLKANLGSSKPTSVTVGMEWSSYPQCALYNKVLLPSLPWAVTVPVTSGSGVLRLPVLFSSNMVLQRAPHEATLWGEAAALAQVSVSVNGTTVGNAMANLQGRWKVQLTRQEASTDNTLEVTVGASTITYTGVAFGDVYLCSGQSNMQADLDFSWGGQEAIQAAAQYTGIRLFNVPTTASLTPLDELEHVSYKEGWVLPSVATLWSGKPNDTMGVFSAVCWYTGRDIYLSLNQSVPIGLLQSSFGGTVVEAWTSLERNADCGPISPLTPHENNTQNQPGGSYNAMIHPLLNLTLTAVLWYQGENNRYEAGRYGCAFTVMIEDWRIKFQQPRLPFYFVLLAAEADSSDSTAVLRAGQLQALSLPYTAVASAIDAGDPSSPIGAVHSRNKSVVGERLAAIARHELYGQTAVQYEGPATSMVHVYMTASADGTLYELEVEYTAVRENEGLLVLATPNCSSCCDAPTSSLLSLQLLNVSQAPLVWPAIGLDPVERVLTANLSVTACEGGAQPWVRVRFEYTGYPQCALYNAARLPALPWTADLQVDMSLADVCAGGSGSGGGGGMAWPTYVLVAGGVALVLVAAVLAAVWWRKRREGGRGASASRGESGASDEAYNRLDEPLASAAA